jgi:hypothetical protein
MLIEATGESENMLLIFVFNRDYPQKYIFKHADKK